MAFFFIYKTFSLFIGSFGINAEETMKSWIVCCVSLLSCIDIILHYPGLCTDHRFVETSYFTHICKSASTPVCEMEYSVNLAYIL